MKKRTVPILTARQWAVLAAVLNSRSLQMLIGAEEWDLSEADEEVLWDIIKLFE